MNLGFRLKQERLRLGLTQAEFAAAGGLAANAQVNYERGARFPRTDYLAVLEKIGVDVLYVVTGSRVPKYPPQPAEAEEVLIGLLRALPWRDLNAITQVAMNLAERAGYPRLEAPLTD